MKILIAFITVRERGNGSTCRTTSRVAAVSWAKWVRRCGRREAAGGARPGQEREVESCCP